MSVDVSSGIFSVWLGCRMWPATSFRVDVWMIPSNFDHSGCVFISERIAGAVPMFCIAR